MAGDWRWTGGGERGNGREGEGDDWRRRNEGEANEVMGGWVRVRFGALGKVASGGTDTRPCGSIRYRWLPPSEVASPVYGTEGIYHNS